MTVCVVGAGISGIACARALTAGGVEVVVLERGHTVGGRMASRTEGGRPMDTGAQYFTVAGETFGALVGDWQARGLAREWTDTLQVYDGGTRGDSKSGPMRWAAPGGLRSLVTDLARGLDVRLETPVTDLDSLSCDAVVLAMPDPQAARLVDLAPLRDRTWEPQLALLARFEERTWELDAAFVNGDDVLSLVADDGARRGDGVPVLVAHSTVDFAARHLENPAAARPAMLGALRDLLGLGAPAWTHVHRWTFARPAEAREAPYWLEGDIGLCGDGWGSPKVETAWASGDALGRALVDRLND